MKRLLTLLVFSVITTQFFAQPVQRLRLDMVFAGDAKQQNIFLEGMHKEAVWSGPIVVDPFNYGEYQYKVFNSAGKEIFSKGFNNLFQEWRTTAEAKTTAMLDEKVSRAKEIINSIK